LESEWICQRSDFGGHPLGLGQSEDHFAQWSGRFAYGMCSLEIPWNTIFVYFAYSSIQTWLDQQPGMPSPFSNLGPGPLQSGAVRSETTVPSEGDDELIPTAIVIKNIPFAVKKEQLVQLMTELNLPLPYAFNYHFDNGVFRGLAFANFTSAEETATVIEVLNHFELQGRKLRVEYKKMLPLQERERIEREKRERRGQLEEQHRPMAASQLQTQSSMSSLTSHIPATSPSPVSQRGQKLGKSEQAIRHFKVSFALFRFDCG
jgi:RNA recognition motif-containing protein